MANKPLSARPSRPIPTLRAATGLAVLLGALLLAAPAAAQSRWSAPRTEKTWVERTWTDPTRPRPRQVRRGADMRQNVHVHVDARRSRWHDPANETALVNAALLRQSVAMSRAAAGPPCESIVSGRTVDCTARGGTRLLGLEPAERDRRR